MRRVNRAAKRCQIAAESCCFSRWQPKTTKITQRRAGGWLKILSFLGPKISIDIDESDGGGGEGVGFSSNGLIAKGELSSHRVKLELFPPRRWGGEVNGLAIREKMGGANSTHLAFRVLFDWFYCCFGFRFALALLAANSDKIKYTANERNSQQTDKQTRSETAGDYCWSRSKSRWS